MTTAPKTFADLNLSQPTLRAIQELGYESMTPIQAEALPILLGEPTDFMGLAATGTGKTAAFSIPLIEHLDSSLRATQALILCPTRELAIQVTGQINLLGKYNHIQAIAVYGGADYGEQIRGIKKGTTIVVGTPGRVVDHLTRGTLKLDHATTVILDEADEMISMGFKDDMETILGSIPAGAANTWLFSATMSREIRKVADEYMKNPKQVQVNRTEMVPSQIQQIYYATSESNKPEVLCKLFDAADSFYGLVFCQTKSLVAELTQYLKDRGYSADCLHGDMEQPARDRTMKSFREHKVKLLVCTDVASRGLDVKDITHVINYSLPRELDNYVHRIGRTARSGKSGYAMSLVTASHRGLIRRIEQLTKTRMIEGKIPTRKDIGAKKIGQTLATFQSQDTFKRAIELMGKEWKAAVSELTPEEITGRFLTMMYPEIFSAEREPEQEIHREPRQDRGGYGDRDSGRPYGRSSYGSSRESGRDSGRDSGDRSGYRQSRDGSHSGGYSQERSWGGRDKPKYGKTGFGPSIRPNQDADQAPVASRPVSISPVAKHSVERSVDRVSAVAEVKAPFKAHAKPAFKTPVKVDEKSKYEKFPGKSPNKFHEKANDKFHEKAGAPYKSKNREEGKSTAHKGTPIAHKTGTHKEAAPLHAKADAPRKRTPKHD